MIFLPVQMVEGLTKVSIDALPNHSWVEVLAEKYTFKGSSEDAFFKLFRPDVHAGTVVEEEEGVEHDVEAVDGELELPLHPVDELELDRVGLVVAQGNQAPSITVVHFHHFRHICFLQCARRHSLL